MFSSSEKIIFLYLWDLSVRFTYSRFLSIRLTLLESISWHGYSRAFKRASFCWNPKVIVDSSELRVDFREVEGVGHGLTWPQRWDFIGECQGFKQCAWHKIGLYYQIGRWQPRHRQSQTLRCSILDGRRL